MNESTTAAASVVVGVLLTLLSGLVPRRTLLGATDYGLPFEWAIRRVVSPRAVQWRVDWVGAGLDVFVWTVLAAAVLVVYGSLRGRSTADGGG